MTRFTPYSNIICRPTAIYVQTYTEWGKASYMVRWCLYNVEPMSWRENAFCGRILPATIQIYARQECGCVTFQRKIEKICRQIDTEISGLFHMLLVLSHFRPSKKHRVPCFTVISAEISLTKCELCVVMFVDFDVWRPQAWPRPPRQTGDRVFKAPETHAKFRYVCIAQQGTSDVIYREIFSVYSGENLTPIRREMTELWSFKDRALLQDKFHITDMAVISNINHPWIAHFWIDIFEI